MSTKKCPQCGGLNWEQATKCNCGYQYPRLQNTGTIKPAREGKKPRREIQTARDWYIWLWISPLFTLPTLLLLILVFPLSVNENEQWIVTVVAVLGSGLWHLILLYPAIGGKTEFIRWHGRQALFLAGVRTAVALIAGLSFYWSDSEIPLILGYLVLFVVWLAGNVWGQSQAMSGDCTLMRWSGHGVGLPIPVDGKIASAKPVSPPPNATRVQHLVNTIRFDPDSAARNAALAELDRLGMVESL